MNHDVSYLAHFLQLFVITQLAQWSSSCRHTLIFNTRIKVDFSASFTLSNICNDARPLSSIVWHIFAKRAWAFTPPSPQLSDRVFSRHSALQAAIPTSVRWRRPIALKQNALETARLTCRRRASTHWNLHNVPQSMNNLRLIVATCSTARAAAGCGSDFGTSL